MSMRRLMLYRRGTWTSSPTTPPSSRSGPPSAGRRDAAAGGRRPRRTQAQDGAEQMNTPEDRLGSRNGKHAAPVNGTYLPPYDLPPSSFGPASSPGHAEASESATIAFDKPADFAREPAREAHRSPVREPLPAGDPRRTGQGPSALRLVWIYPDLLSTYGDRGNLLMLTRRAALRGI